MWGLTQKLLRKRGKVQNAKAEKGREKKRDPGGSSHFGVGVRGRRERCRIRGKVKKRMVRSKLLKTPSRNGKGEKQAKGTGTGTKGIQLKGRKSRGTP